MQNLYLCMPNLMVLGNLLGKLDATYICVPKSHWVSSDFAQSSCLSGLPTSCVVVHAGSQKGG